LVQLVVERGIGSSESPSTAEGVSGQAGDDFGLTAAVDDRPATALERMGRDGRWVAEDIAVASG